MNTRLGILRYVGYTLIVAAVVWLVYSDGVRDPQGLGLAIQVDSGAATRLTTTEYSLVEQLQNLLLAGCVLLFAWVALRDRLRRPMAVMFMVLFILALVHELDFFFDRLVADNVWQALSGLIVAPAAVYLLRHRARLIAGWQRSWPSAGLAMVMAGLIVLVPFTQLLARPPLWAATMGEHDQRAAMLAFEEMSELGGYLLIAIGSLEFLYAWSRLPKTREMDRPRRRRRQPRH